MRSAGATTVLLMTMIVGDIVVAQNVPAAARFEVVSVRHVVRDPPSSLIEVIPFRITPRGQMFGQWALRNLIQFAYDIASYEQVVTVNSDASGFLAEVFDVDARPPESPSPPTREEIKAMTRLMLAERFRLRVRIDTELVSATVLRMIKPGVFGRGLRPAPEGCSPVPSGVNPYDPKFAEAYLRSCSLSTFDGRVRGIVSLDAFARSMSALAGRPILDHTGLEGVFAFNATIDMTTLRQEVASRLGPPLPRPTQSGAQAFVDALRDQMGLSARTEERQPIRRFVVEHVGPLVEN
jgi:uncharacterized protein (TIGR03435 family)